MRQVTDGTIEASVPTRVAEIIRHEATADQLDADADSLRADADSHRWEAARLIYGELRDGTSQRELARAIGKSHTHVQHMARTWESWQLKLPPERPPFNQAYNSAEVRDSRKHTGSLATQGYIEALAEQFEAEPATADLARAALKRAKDKATERLDGNPQHKRNRRVYQAEAAAKHFKAAILALEQFTIAYQPANRDEAEQLAGRLNQAASIIRQRASEMD